MTRPKKWFLVEDNDKSVVIKNTDGLIKKPNAAQPLGKVITVRAGIIISLFPVYYIVIRCGPILFLCNVCVDANACVHGSRVYPRKAAHVSLNLLPIFFR